MEQTQRIALIGGPGTGKTTLIEALEKAGFTVHHEISRQVTLKAQDQGIDQLFLTDPMAFSNELLKGRIEQYHQANAGIHFYDRGIPDIPAYHVFTNDPIPQEYVDASQNYRYDQVFFLPPWDSIYQSDNERYESYEQAVQISEILVQYYRDLGYQVHEVPRTEVNKRLDFIFTTAGID